MLVMLRTYYFLIVCSINQTKENMKKIVITLFLVLFTSSVYAGSCPMMAKSINDKIAEASAILSFILFAIIGHEPA